MGNEFATTSAGVPQTSQRGKMVSYFPYYVSLDLFTCTPALNHQEKTVTVRMRRVVSVALSEAESQQWFRLELVAVTQLT